MSSYQEVVIANGVDAFWRLNGLIDTHPLLADIGGSGRHAECFDVVDHHHGLASPIENDPTSFAMSARVGRWTDTINRLNTFAWQVWGKAVASASPKVLLCRSGQVAITSSNLIWISADGDTVNARLFIDGTTYNLSASCAPGFWYYIVLVYNAGVITLYVNGVVADSVSGVTGDMDVGSATDFYIGAQQSIVVNANTSLGVDEPAIGPALLAGAVLQNYESALNALLLNGYSNVIPSAVLYSDIEPDPISFPFRHNWSDSFIERISFATGISTAVRGYEQANGQRIKPRREIEISQVLRDDAERRMLRAKLNAHQHRKWFVPMLNHRDRLTSSLSAGATTITLSTLYKDYEIGGYVGLRQLDEAGRIIASEEALITNLTSTEITCAPLVNSYTNAEVYPAKRAILQASVSPRGHTDSVEDLTIQAQLLAEDEKVTPHRIAAWTPTISYKSYEVFDPASWQSNDWTETRDYEVTRSRETIDFETGIFGVDSDAIGANETFSYRITLEGLDKQAAFLGWFYARAGSLNYLWVPTMQRDFAITSAASGDITVEGHNYFDNFSGSEHRQDLAFVYNDNTLAIRRIESVVIDGANEVLTADSTLPTLTNLRSLSCLLFCRLEADTLEIAHVTDNKAQFAWLFRSVLSSPM